MGLLSIHLIEHPSKQVSLTSGVTPTTGCAGFIPGVERVGFPGLCLANAGNGVGGTDYVSAWPAGVHVAASWNKELTYQRAYGIGGEARIKGVNILLGPVVGPAGRVVQGGRNWEGKSCTYSGAVFLIHRTARYQLIHGIEEILC